MQIHSALLAAALASGGLPAAAGQFDTTTLFSRGAWSVEHTYDSSDGSSWCAADSANDIGQSLSVVAHDTGGVTLLIADDRWRLSPRSVAFRVAVDGSVWDAAGEAQDNFVYAPLAGDLGATFIEELMSGAGVAVSSDLGRELARFSLSGSRQALLALMECWSRIDASDPFTRASDPF